MTTKIIISCILLIILSACSTTKENNSSRDIAYKTEGNIVIDKKSSYRNSEYEKMLIDTIKSESAFLKQNSFFIIPTNLKLELVEKSDKDAYFDRNMDDNYFYIRLPYTLELGKTYSGEEMKPAVMHEFAHFIFKLTAIKRSKIIHNKFMESEKVRAELRKLYHTPEGSPNEEEIKKRIDWLEDEIAINVERVEASFGARMAAYNELFADLVPAIIFENTDIFTSIGIGRSFSADIKLEEWVQNPKNQEEHVYYSPLRKYVYSLFLENKSKMTKQEFLAKIIHAMILEIEVSMQSPKGKYPTQIEANKSLGERIRKEFSSR